MSKIRPAFLPLLLLVGGLGLALLPLQQAEAAPQGTKFYVVEWKITWEEDKSGVELLIKGRTKEPSGGPGSAFEIESPVASGADVLDVLRTCAVERLSGTAILGGESRGTAIGSRLTSLTCRAILK